MTDPRSRSEGGFTLVELLVVVVLMGVIGAATLSVLVSTSRAETYTDELRTVLDDGRTSLARVRLELRAARLIDEDESGPSAVRFWVDQDQDSIQQPDELVCYRVELVAGETDRWRLVRYEEPSPPAGTCESAAPAATGQVIAQTLRENAVFTYVPTDATDPGEPITTDGLATHTVTVRFVLDVDAGGRGPGQTEVTTTVRLRNVA